MKNRKTINSEKGFSVAEIVIAAAVFSVFVAAMGSAWLTMGRTMRASGHKMQATALAEEALEASRNLRDSAFSNLTDGSYGLATSSSKWLFSGSSDSRGIFNRQTVIASAASNQKQVTSTVTWQERPGYNRSVSLTTYFTNWRAAVSGSWSNATTTSSLDLSGNQDGIKVQISGNYAYMVRNNSGSANFMVIDVTTPTTPTVLSSLTLNGTPNNIFVSGSYAYVTSSDNSEELQIISIATPAAPALAGSFNSSGNNDGLGIFVSGSLAYLTLSGGTNFKIIDISTPASPSLVGSATLSGTPYEVAVSGSYAYVASGNNSSELEVINVSAPALPVQEGQLNLSGNTDAITLALSGSTVLLGQGSALFTIDASNPLLPSLSGSVNVGGTLNDIGLNLSGSYVFLATADNSGEFKVVDISSLAAPSIFGTVDTAGPNALNGVAYDSSSNIAVAVGNANSEEFDVLSPQ